MEKDNHQRTDEGHDAEGPPDSQQAPAEGHVRVEELAEPGEQRRHRDEIQGGADPGDAQLEAEDHVELLALEPGHCVGVLGDGQRLTADAEHEPADLHQGEVVEEATHGEDDLTWKAESTAKNESRVF